MIKMLKKSLVMLAVFSLLLSCTFNTFVGIGNDKDVQIPTVTTKKIVRINSSDSKKNSEVTGTLDKAYVGRLFKLIGTAYDDKEIRSVTVEADGIAKIKASGKSDWEASVDATDLPSGSNKFTITVKDKSGKSRSEYLTLMLDNEGPDIDLLVPSPGNAGDVISVMGEQNFTGTVSDNYTVDSTGLFQIIDSSSVVTLEQIITNENGVWSVSGYDTMDYTPGFYTMRITFADKLGNNTVKEYDLECLHEADKPVVVLQSPDPSADPPQEVGRYLYVSGSATDNRGITKVFYDIRNSSFTSLIGGYKEIVNSDETAIFNFSKNIDLTALGLSSGTFYVSVYSLDNGTQAKMSDVVSAKFIVDSDIPSIRFLDSTTTPVGATPSVSSYLNSNFTVTAESITPDPKTVQYRVVQNGANVVGWTNMSTSDNTIYTANINVEALSSDSATVYVRVEKSGKTSGDNSNGLVVYIDKVNPVPSFISHASGDVVNGAVTLRGAASDNMGLGSVELYDPHTLSWNPVTGTTIWSYVASTDALDIETKFGVVPSATAVKTYQIRVTDKAGNTATQSLNLTIDPSKDIPVLTLLEPSVSGTKISSMMSILATMMDDDYPAKDMTANISIYNVSTGEIVKNQDFTKTSTGFPNLTLTVDPETLDDMTEYQIRVNGTDWHGKTAVQRTVNFFVDKNVPVITVETPTPAVIGDFRNTSITFRGTVKDKNNLDATNPLVLIYPGPDGATHTMNVSLTAPTLVGEFYTYSFDCTLNSASADTGFSTLPYDATWSDAVNIEWANGTHLFKLKAKDETGLESNSTFYVNFDCHQPVLNVVTPSAGQIISSSPMTIVAGMDDSPTSGTSFTQTLKNMRVSLGKGGVCPYTTALFPSGIIKDYNVDVNGTTITGNAASFSIQWNIPGDVADAGDYFIRLEGYDKAGNLGAVKNVSFVKNSNPPSVASVTVNSAATYLKGTVTMTVVGTDTGTTPANGVSKLELFIDNNVNGIIDALPAYSDSVVLTGNNLSETNIFSVNLSSLSSGKYEVLARVTDKTGLTAYKSGGAIFVDNTYPVVSTPSYGTLGYAGAVTTYTTYLNLSVTINDNYSLAGDTPKFKIGTTSGGAEVTDWKLFNSVNYTGESEYTASYDDYIYVFDQTGILYVTVRATDSAGNIKDQIFSINKGALPTIAFDPLYTDNRWTSYKNDTNTGNSYIDLSGTIVSGADKLWIKLNSNPTWTDITSSISGTTFNKQYLGSSFTAVDNTFTLRVSKGGAQNIITKTLKIDTSVPVITIGAITAVADAGYVNGSNLSGKVLISGTYTDNNQDSISTIAGAGMQISINGGTWRSLDATFGSCAEGTFTVTKNSGSVPWAWTFTWNTESITEIVKNSVDIKVKCNDLASNSGTASTTRNVVPYIKSITSDTGGPVYDVKSYNGSTWENIGNRKYSVGQGTKIKITGYNLKYSTTAPTVTLGGSGLTVTSSAIHDVYADVPVNDTTGKTGDLLLTVSGISGEAVKLYVWKFARVGNDTDTYDAKFFDMNIMGNNKAFITFTRDHQVPPNYSKPSGQFNADDYSAYRIQEADSYGPGANAYNNYGVVDPMFYTANVVYGNYGYMASCLDEWTGGDYNILQKSGIYNVPVPDTKYYHAKADGNSNYLKLSDPWNLNTVKYGSAALKNNGSGNGYIYVAQYDDDSRKDSPTLRHLLWIIKLDNYNTSHNNIFNIDTNHSPGKWNSVAVRTADNGPVVAYYTAGNDSINVAYNTTSSDTPGALGTKVTSANGGKYNSIAVGSGNLIMVAYQDRNQNLTLGTLSGIGDTSFTNTILENQATEGITGFQTSLSWYSGGKLGISYVNNNELNSQSALHFASFNGTLSETNLADRTQWDYMRVPSIVAVNADERTVLRWTATNAVIAYKGDSRIYLARLVM